MLIAKNIENNTMYNMQELHISLAIFTSSIFSVYSSTSLSANYFLHLQFFFSNIKWSVAFTFTFTRIPNISFITYTFINQFFTIWLFHCCLLLQTLASSLHLHLHVSCHFMRLVSLVLDIRLKALSFSQHQEHTFLHTGH